MAKFDSILVSGKGCILNYDHGLSYGPAGFNLRSVNPDHVLDIALDGHFSGIMLNPGVAHKYYNRAYRDVPLIVKLSATPNLPRHYPVSVNISSVEQAIKLGAKAVSYDIYDGNPKEGEMFRDFSRVCETAHDYGIPVIANMVPRHPNHPTGTDLLAYLARIAMELGADYVKLKYNGHLEGYKWIVKCAGRCKVLVTEDKRMEDHYFLNWAHDIMKTGAAGVIVSHHIWGHEKPYHIAKAVQSVVYNNKHHNHAREYL